MEASALRERIFKVSSSEEFRQLAMDVFRWQAIHNKVYAEYLSLLGRKTEDIQSIEQIPFLPVELFKTHRVISSEAEPEIIFSSSGTTGMEQSKHYVTDLSLYEESFLEGFRYFYGEPSNYCILALLPGYLEREGSSLIYMVQKLMEKSGHSQGGFFLNEQEELAGRLAALEKQGQPTLLIGVSFALLDFAENYPMPLTQTLVMETGGMKGRRKELTRRELHEILKQRLGVKEVHSEYGMTELLSQAYAKSDGLFQCPPWMKIIGRDINDPFQTVEEEQNNVLNIIDLANLYSCSFLATSDLGKLYTDGRFEVLGRMDSSDVRGCNLLLA